MEQRLEVAKQWHDELKREVTDLRLSIEQSMLTFIFNVIINDTFI